MWKHRPIVLGCDPGERNTAFGVMGDGAILHTSLLLRDTMSWDEYCVMFQGIAKQLIRTHLVDVLAVEDFIWFNEYAKVEAPIRELIGIARTFSRTIPVRVVPMNEWSQAITGVRPSKRVVAGVASPLWKKTIRTALALRCQEMGMDLNAEVGKDLGGHQVDALGLALYCQDGLWIEGHAQCMGVERRR